ncbi:MAG: CHAP domain-containing protein, partial [Sphingorhabdus sp.]
MRTLLLALIGLASPAHALNEGLQCVPYARVLTGVEIRGDAHRWWTQAEGRYERDRTPRIGAVMAFVPHGNMRLGHVAAVRQIVDRRTLLISHANWPTIDGVRGHIEDDVRVIDVSENNDWSRVRVWYTPNGALGTTEWPVHGFIHPQKPRSWGEA